MMLMAGEWRDLVDRYAPASLGCPGPVQAGPGSPGHPYFLIETAADGEAGQAGRSSQGFSTGQAGGRASERWNSPLSQPPFPQPPTHHM